MTLTASLVTVRKIAPTTPRAAFPPDHVEALARLILEAGTLAMPLLVRRTGVESFDLVAGELAFHGAARARDLDPARAEAALAFIVTDESEPALLRQLELLSGPQPEATPQPADGGTIALAARLEQTLSQQFRHFEQHLTRESERNRETTRELAARIPQPPKTLALLNGEDDPALARNMEAAGLKGKALEKVMSGLKAARPYSSLHEAVHVEGFSADRLVKLIDVCEGHLQLVPNGQRHSQRAAAALEAAGV